MAQKFKTLNNVFCKSIVKACCESRFDHAVYSLWNHRDKFSDDLFVRLFDFCFFYLGLQEYYNVLKRLDKTVGERQAWHLIGRLIQCFRMKGGVYHEKVIYKVD